MDMLTLVLILVGGIIVAYWASWIILVLMFLRRTRDIERKYFESKDADRDTHRK